MHYRSFTKLFLLSSVVLLITIFGFNVIIDPYDVTGHNILSIKHKLTRDGRLQKINRIKQLKSIDNLILGSSRSERLNPDTVSKLLGGYTYTFGIGGASIEDALGLLLYLEKENKLPTNIILCIDFNGFSKDIQLSEGFYNSPELNFLNHGNVSTNYAAKLFSIDALRASIKTFKAHLKNVEPDSYIGNNGFLNSKHPTESGNIEDIRKVADEYYVFSYKHGEIQFSEKRFEYLQRIVSISKHHKIHLYVMLTPIHIELHKRIQTNPQLFEKLAYVKSRIANITPYYDAMIVSSETVNKENFEDAVHYNEQMGNYLLKTLIAGQN